MVTLVPMGYGVTDENGVAKLDHDMEGNVLSHSYTGVGAGRIDLLASIDDPDNVSYSGEGTFLQETYALLDCMFYDTCITGTTTEWFLENSPSVQVLDDGTVLSNTVNQNKYMWAKSPTVTATQRSDCINFTPSFNVEFIVIETTGNCYFNIGDGVSSDRNRTMGQFGITGNNHIKVEVRSDSIRYYKDGTELTNLAITNITQLISRVGLFVQQNASVKFKDFKIYPI